MIFSLNRYDWSLRYMKSMAQTTNLDVFIEPVAHGLNETFLFCMAKREKIPCYKLLEKIKSVDAGLIINN